jgi:hypothetical protein
MASPLSGVTGRNRGLFSQADGFSNAKSIEYGSSKLSHIKA